PGVRQLLLAVRRAALEGRAVGRDDADVLGGRGRRPRARGLRPRGPGARRARGRRQGGGELQALRRADAHRPLARLRGLPRRRHRLSQPRGARTAERQVPRRGPGLAERDVRQPEADRQRGAHGRRRVADRQIPDDVHRMTTTASQPRERLLRIGEVVRRLTAEFPDISISKIRYLEDEGLLTPRRTQGGYRLFSEADLERLQTILRLQRDEFLPLRVIREELASPYGKDRKRRRPAALSQPEDEIDLAELCDRSGATMELAQELSQLLFWRNVRDSASRP